VTAGLRAGWCLSNRQCPDKMGGTTGLAGTVDRVASDFAIMRLLLAGQHHSHNARQLQRQQPRVEPAPSVPTM
jgi:hypothetical protein